MKNNIATKLNEKESDLKKIRSPDLKRMNWVRYHRSDTYGNILVLIYFI
jgi:hypothetical protein